MDVASRGGWIHKLLGNDNVEAWCVDNADRVDAGSDGPILGVVCS